jgi:predicted Zn-dependent protease
MIRQFLVVFFTITFLTINAQNKALGIQQFRSGNFQEAADEFETLYKKQPDEEVYEFLYKSYIGLEEYKKAVKLSEKEIKRAPRSSVQIDIGHAYLLDGQPKKGENTFEEIIKSLPLHQNEILSIGNKFLGLKYYDWAEQTYLKGIKVLNGDYNFAFELGEVYSVKGQLSSMARAIVSALEYGPDYLEPVQNAIGTKLYGDKNGKVQLAFVEETQRLVQKYPDETAYMELLIWLSTLENDFESAFLYSKSLDKRLQESGRRILELARTCRTNQRYDVANDCYEYLLTKGDRNYYYRVARVELVETLKEEMDASTYLSDLEKRNLRKAYESAIEELGKNQETVALIVDYAHLLAFQFGEVEASRKLLDELLSQRLSETQKAAVKVEKADQLVLQGKIWDAVLLYGQVHTAFKEDQIGHEAKLKKAKSYYYAGDFDWAKSQLDVLKGATSKLIANDALELSVLISDNLGMDTTTAALKIFARADFYYYQGLKDKSDKALDSLLFYFPTHSTLRDNAYYLKAKISLDKKDFDDCLSWLEKAIAVEDLLADESLMLKGKVLMNEKKDVEGAMKAFETIIVEHPGSVLVAQARKYYRSLREQLKEQ